MILLCSPVIAQKSDQPFKLGNAGTFLRDVRKQMGDKNHQLSRRSILVKTSLTESLSLKVNVDRTSNEAGEFITGEVENVEGSSFLIRGSEKDLEGHIIIKKSNEAYKIFSDRTGMVHIKKVDINSLICVNYEAYANASGRSATPQVAEISAAVANLQSFPGARGCVLLDFDGQYVSGTPWNNGNPINAAPSGMSDADIQAAWEVVSEDYRPFHVNITTNESVFNSYPKTMRMRAIFTPTNTAAPGAGGVAYIGSFNWNDDTPCWIYVLSGKSGGEAASHEVGHTFGLGHDGRTNPSEGYFAGQGDWAPIMGVGYYKNITQWSKGEYNYANNFENDVAKISSATYNVGYRGDDYGNSTGAATAISAGSVSRSGIIESEADWDFFSFNSGSGTINLNVNTVSRFGDLDIIVRLYNSAGAQIGSYNPAGLNASLSASVSAGKYYISVDGTGAGNPATDGYSAYASIGSYTITGTIPVPVSSGVATTYKDCNYGGSAVSLPVGDYTLSALNSRGILNDDISSISLNSGYQMIIYENDNFGGASLAITSNNSCLVGQGWNDRASSLRVSTISASFSATIQAENYSTMLGVQTEACSEGGSNVGWIDATDWMAFNSITVPSSTSYLVEYRVASPNATGQLSLDLNAGSIQLGVLNVPNTGGWQNWTTISHTVNITAGTYNFGIYAPAGGWNINWWRITKTGAGRGVTIAESTETSSLFNTQGSPNPFQGSAKISVNLPKAGHTEVSVFSGLGTKVSDLHKGNLEAGQHEFEFNAENMPSGLYIYSVIHNGQRITGKLIKQ
jgi:uncharacterized protein YdeI (BOF family)